MLGDSEYRPTVSALSHVSILVLLDHAGRPRRRSGSRCEWIRFRSLFSWIMLGDGDSTIPAESARRFRSLFSWIMLGDRDRAVNGADPDVSILVLLDHAGRQLCNAGAISDAGFRSLFSWIMLGDIEHSVTATKDGFRSLFSWIMLGDPTSSVTPYRHAVSILVLLDHAGRPASRAVIGCSMPCFDPCSPGSCWATRRLAR